MQNQEESRVSQIFTQFEEVLFPHYPPGISVQQLFKKYEPLKDYLYRIDNANIGKDIPIEAKDALLSQLIRLMNEACSYVHRIEVSNLILTIVSEFNNNLENLPVGRLPIAVSEWSDQLYVAKLTEYKIIAQKHQLEPQITVLLDRIYQQQRRIPHLDHLLLSYPKLFVQKNKTQNQLLKESQIGLPLPCKLYLAIIGATTMGCKYLWNQLAKKFLKAGGDERWLTQGIRITPPFMQKLSQMSWVMAYKFNKLHSCQYFFEAITACQTNQTRFLEGLCIISYYQALSCFILVTGLIPQTSQLITKHIPFQKILKPSIQSFEAMLHKQYKEQICEQERADDFANTLMVADNQFDRKSQSSDGLTGSPSVNKFQVTENKNLFESSDDEDDFINTYEFLHPENDQQNQKNTIKTLAKESAQYEKLKNMKSYDYLKSLHEKYLNLDDVNHLSMTQPENKQCSWNAPIKPFRKYTQVDMAESPSFDSSLMAMAKHSSTDYDDRLPQRKRSYEQQKKKQKKSSLQLIQRQSNIIHASDWNFEQNALEFIQTYVSPNFARELKKFLKCLREQTASSMNSQMNQLQDIAEEDISPTKSSKSKSHSSKCRNMQVYYEMINNYFYESIDYTKLAAEGVTSSEKNFIKLVTKSPYLFNRESFLRMKTELRCNNETIMNTLLQIVSYKLELNISIVFSMYSRYRLAKEE